MTTPGPLALVGGGEWRPGCDFDASLLEASGGTEVLVLPTAAAYEHPERAVESAARWFEGLGASVRGLPVLRRPDAEDGTFVKAVAEARFVYLAGGSPLHLRSVLKSSSLWQALLGAWQGGAVLAGSSAGAMVLTDPMVDPRGGAFTLGLGLVSQVAVIPHADSWSPEKFHRTITLAPADLPVVAIDERTAAVRQPEGGWTAAGAGTVRVWLNGEEAGLDALPG
jgi:cyanophycinase